MSNPSLYDALADIPVPLLVLGPDGRVVIQSRGFDVLAQVPLGEPSLALGLRVGDLPNLQTPHLLGLAERVLAGDRISNVPVDFTTLRGVRLSVSMDAGPFPDGHRWIVLRDLAEGDALAGRLLQAQRMEFMGVAVTGVIHDLNNILTGLGGTLELLRDGRTAGDDLLLGLTALLRRSRDLTRRLLESARPSSEGPAPLDLRTPVRQAADLMRHSLGSGVEVSTALPNFAVPVHADRTEFIRTLFNLGINARDAMDGQGGKVHLEVSVRRDPERCRSERWSGPDYARIRVWDTGPGIPDGLIERVFEPFFSTKAPDASTGMGLSVARHVVMAHQGTMDYVSIEGRGACFDIDLPLFRGAVEGDEPAPPVSLARMEAVRPLEGMRILLADDEAALRLMLADALGLRGADVVAVADGRSAIDAITRADREQKPFAAALLDFHMPGVGGLALLREARAIGPTLRIILCSGMEPDSTLREEFERLGVRFLPKPFRLHEAVSSLVSV